MDNSCFLYAVVLLAVAIIMFGISGISVFIKKLLSRLQLLIEKVQDELAVYVVPVVIILVPALAIVQVSLADLYVRYRISHWLFGN